MVDPHSLPYFCYGEGMSERMSEGGASSGMGGGAYSGAGGSQNSTASGGGPPSAVIIPLMGKLDTCFIPKASVEFSILAFFVVYYVPTLYLYYKYRNHVLIKYRQPKVVFLANFISAIISCLTPIYRYFDFPCLVNTWTTNILVFAACILTYSRYVRTYYMQRLSIFQLKFGEKKNSNSKKDKSGKLLLKDPVLSQSYENQTLKTSFSMTTTSSLSTEVGNDIFGIADPVLYFKKLNKIITKKITLILVVFPVVFFVVYSVIISITNWDRMTKTCVNEDRAVGTPKTILNLVIITSSLFFFYQAFIKQKWDIELRLEYTIFIIFLALCTLIMQLTVRLYFPDDMVRYRSYIFLVLTTVLQFICVILPLIKIFINRFHKEEGKLTQEEFLAKMTNNVFKAQVKEIATKTFCIENVLFFDAHSDLMNIIINYYNKKNNIPYSESSNYTSSDLLHRNTINPVLYKPFDNIFKNQFDQIYNLYIKEDGIAAINIKSSTLKTIEEQMETDNYNYLMFCEAAEEIGELLYSNIYPRMIE